MKKLILLVALISLVGCANHPMRTGSIAVNKFDTAGYETNNPLQVKDDVVQRLSSDLQKSILKSIPEETKMKVAASCAQGADYDLGGKFSKVEVELDSHWRFVTVTVKTKFYVDVTGYLKDCKTGKLIAEVRHDKGNEDMRELIDDLGKYIVNKLKKDNSITLLD